MTVIGIPVINRPDLLARLLDSIDEPWDVVVIDNSPDMEIADAILGRPLTFVDPGENLGVAGSWNSIITGFPNEPWWCLANADTKLAPGDLARLAEEMAKPGPAWVGMNGDWRVFGINRACVDTVGLFDENFHPIYCEDADYEYRCHLAGVPWYAISGGATHEGSAAIRSSPDYAAANARTYPANVAYYRDKWGGDMRGGETYTTPFNMGGSVADWELDPARVKALAW